MRPGNLTWEEVYDKVPFNEGAVRKEPGAYSFKWFVMTTKGEDTHIRGSKEKRNIWKRIGTKAQEWSPLYGYIHNKKGWTKVSTTGHKTVLFLTSSEWIHYKPAEETTPPGGTEYLIQKSTRRTELQLQCRGMTATRREEPHGSTRRTCHRWSNVQYGNHPPVAQERRLQYTPKKRLAPAREAVA